MITAAVIAIVVLLAIAFVVALALEPGPGPEEVAVAYERAWDHLDFDTVWTLSGAELVDGLPRKEFVQAKEDAYAGHGQLSGLAASVVPEQVTKGMGYALARTRVDLRDGEVVRHDVVLARRGGRWVVVEYRLESGAASTR